MDPEDESQEANSLERTVPQILFTESLIAETNKDIDVINAACLEQNLNQEDPEFPEEEAEEAMWASENVQKALEEEREKVSTDASFDTEYEREHMKQIFSGTVSYRPDPETEKLYEYKANNPDEQPPIPKKKPSKTLSKRRVSKERKKTTYSNDW